MKKEVIDTLKSIVEDAKKQGHIIIRIEDLENAIPELTESEDEKIRREILDFLLTTNDPRLVGKIKRYDWISWLENWPKIKENWSKGEEINLKSKSEPKFKIGDWVVLFPHDDYNRKVVQILRISSALNYFTTEGKWFGDGIETKLWTIQDAKNGDILTGPNGPFMFLGCTDVEHPGCPVAYFGINSLNNFSVSSGSHWWCDYVNVHPAAKGQRDFLLQKMHEAGYEWNSETKTLYYEKRKFKV